MKLSLKEKLSQLSFFNKFYKSEIESLKKQVEEMEADYWHQQTTIDLLVDDINFMKQGGSFDEMLEQTAFGMHPCVDAEEAEYIEAMQGRG
tara:strand:- start:933 stop:1205 length:273 start_codon:yes stop_codon:yes gene_type:complete